MTTAARLPYTISNQSLTFFVKGKPYSLTREHDRFAEAKALLLAPGDHDAEHLMALVDARKALLRDSYGAITFIGQDIVFKGQVLTGLWVERILEFQKAGEPFAPLWNALGSLMQNPTPEAIQRLPVFLEKSQLGFLEDGRFVAYKAVKDDYFDLHTGRTHRNMVGDVPHMDRDRVDADPNSCCSTGLHVGTPGYVKTWAGNARRVMLIAVWPHDVVAVPYSYEGNKMRICAYEVIDELDEEYAATILGRPVLTPRSQLPAPNEASLPNSEDRDASDLEPTVEPEDEGDDVEQEAEGDGDASEITAYDSVQVGDVIAWRSSDAPLISRVLDRDGDGGIFVLNIDGHSERVVDDEFDEIIAPEDVIAAMLVVAGAYVTIAGHASLKDGVYLVAGLVEDEDGYQDVADDEAFGVYLGNEWGPKVPVANNLIQRVVLNGLQLWPRTEVTTDAEGGTALRSLDGHDLRRDLPSPEVLAAAQARADSTPLVGDNVEVGEGGWPPAGVYPVATVNGVLITLQTEHDGLVDINADQIVRVIRKPRHIPIPATPDFE